MPSLPSSNGRSPAAGRTRRIVLDAQEIMQPSCTPGCSLGPRTRNLARSGAPPPPPSVHPALEAAKPLSPKPRAPRPPPSTPSPSAPPRRPIPGLRLHFPLCASLRLMHPLGCTPSSPTHSAPVPSSPAPPPAAPTSFPAPPLAPGVSQFGHRRPPFWTHRAGPEVEGPGRVPGAGVAAASAAVTTPRRQPPRWQPLPNQGPAPEPVTSPPSAGPPDASWELSEFFRYTSLPPPWPKSGSSINELARCPAEPAWKRAFHDDGYDESLEGRDRSLWTASYSTPGLCQSVAMLPPGSHLLSLLLVIGTRSTVPSPWVPPQGCYVAEEAGERTFRCSQAGLSAVPPGIPNDTRKLYLDANRLASVPAGAFQHLPVLEELDLSHNVLVHLSGAAFQGLAGTLRHLDLSANQLASVPVEAFMGLQIQVNLSANPWRCDCALQEVLRQVRLAPGTGTGIVCGPGARPDLVGQEFLPLAGEEELCGTGRGGARRSTDVALLVTMGGWLVLVVAYLVHYVWQNRDETRHPLKRAPLLPVRSEDSSTLSTVV
ncbi:leucine-rich repeat-containing protein 3C [Equus quagga]|uniref:leucine-rich repeat-containing protein 3C n=1 Tax=Equus quagga TaxID=89248 RepID=UPI001EE2EBAB|nr:leucine-rich repeat-containing protein 3C [Equus quagga]